jgi:hypothetical protein
LKEPEALFFNKSDAPLFSIKKATGSRQQATGMIGTRLGAGGVREPSGRSRFNVQSSRVTEGGRLELRGIRAKGRLEG